MSAADTTKAISDQLDAIRKAEEAKFRKETGNKEGMLSEADQKTLNARVQQQFAKVESMVSMGSNALEAAKATAESAKRDAEAAREKPSVAKPPLTDEQIRIATGVALLGTPMAPAGAAMLADANKKPDAPKPPLTDEQIRIATGVALLGTPMAPAGAAMLADANKKPTPEPQVTPAQPTPEDTQKALEAVSAIGASFTPGGAIINAAMMKALEEAKKGPLTTEVKPEVFSGGPTGPNINVNMNGGPSKNDGIA
ncbi:MAG: hypothetical protein K2Q01_05620 [Rickettsiales bacterium]|nr:hypothetical protein [Rickettsiales bacterium]